MARHAYNSVGDFVINDDYDSVQELENKLDQVPETQFEELQEFVLANQGEVQAFVGQKVTLKLKYAVLLGCSLTLYDEIPPSTPDSEEPREEWETVRTRY